MPILWKSSYSVGVVAMDREHQHFFELMRELDSALAVGSGHQVVDTVLFKLMQWADAHFSHEEQMMSEQEYPHLDEHRAQHDDARRQIERYEQDHKLGKNGVPVSLLLFLNGWLRQHILKTDLRYTAFFHQRGIR